MDNTRYLRVDNTRYLRVDNTRYLRVNNTNYLRVDDNNHLGGGDIIKKLTLYFLGLNIVLTLMKLKFSCLEK